MVGAEFRPWLGPNPERGWASFLHRGGANFLKPLGLLTTWSAVGLVQFRR